MSEQNQPLIDFGGPKKFVDSLSKNKDAINEKWKTSTKKH